MERVALDPLEEEDTTKLYEIVKEHYYYTKSAVAKELLENWSRMSKQFLKVCILPLIVLVFLLIYYIFSVSVSFIHQSISNKIL